MNTKTMQRFCRGSLLRQSAYTGLILIALLLLCTQASAQSQLLMTGSEPEADAAQAVELENPAAVREMVARLSDQEVRDLLLQRLDATTLAATRADTATESGTETIEHAILGIAGSVGHAIVQLPNLGASFVKSFRNFGAERGSNGVLRFLGVLVIAVLMGLLAERVVNLLAGNWRAKIARAGEQIGLVNTARVLALRLLLDIIGLTVFILVTRTTAVSLLEPSEAPFARALLFNMIAIPRLMAAVSRFLLAPNRPELRLVNTDDWSAKFLHRHQIGWFVLFGLTSAIVEFNALNDVPPGETRIAFWLSATLHIYLGWIAWRAREGLSMMLRGADGDVSPMEERIARLYPFFIIALSIGMWLLVEYLLFNGRFDLLAGGKHILTMYLLGLAPAFDTLVRGLVRHAMPPMTGDGEIAARAWTSTKRCYIRVGRVLIFGLVLLTVARMWGLEFHGVASQGLGAAFAARLFEVLGILAFGYLVWELVTWWINHKLAREHTAAGIDLSSEEPGGGEGGGAGSSRTATVLPLVRMILQATIVVITVLLGLGNIGIDITPLLAGAGIVGLAIGFGAQKLVADVVSGIFFLVDDAFRSGEYVDVEGTVGTVEKISMRSMQLRHHRGPVHTIPYGEIPKITNYSRDWVIMKLKFTVPFDTDLQKVKKIFKKIGKDMLEIDEFAEDFMQPFKSQGVLEVDDVGIVVRGKFMAKPGKQFTLRKEIYSRVQQEFEANGIQFARKEVRVKLDDDTAGRDLDEREKQTVAAAASEAAIKPEPLPAT